MESKGLGDTIEKITTATGIKKLVEWVAGEDCGCDKRKEKLNKMFPYKAKDCLTETEYKWADNYFSSFRNTISRDDQRYMLNIHNRIFKSNKTESSCGSCVRELYNDVERLYKIYKDEIQQ